MPNKLGFQKWLLAFAVTIVAVVLCVAYIDRPLADFLEQHFRHTPAWDTVRQALKPFSLAVAAALLFLLGCGAVHIAGRPLPNWTKTPMLASWAAMWGIAAEQIFKAIFGRIWADPGYVQEHKYGFDLFQGGSFPSGTATISTAIITVLWILAPRTRIIGVVIVLLLCAAVVINNYHWLGDVVAGIFLGASIGWMTVLLQRK